MQSSREAAILSQNAPETVWPAGGAHSAPPNALAALKGKGKGKGKVRLGGREGKGGKERRQD